MNNAELIKALRCCIVDFNSTQSRRCNECPYRIYADGKYGCENKLKADAADALEAAEQRIWDLEDDLMSGTVSEPERFGISGYSMKDLLLFAEMCKRNDVQEADLKQAAWNLEFAVRAWKNEREEIVKNIMDEIVMRYTPDFEKAYGEMMPSGARMDGAE